MSENESAPKEKKTARVVVNRQQEQTSGDQLAPHSASHDHDDGEEHEEKPAVVNKLTECVDFDHDAEVRLCL